jgi:exodeoxyribonuclease V gamma subunit
MSLKIFTGNRMETLVEAIAGVVEKSPVSPFAPEVIVVQSKGMQRWLAMELAGRFGVWANCDFPFPNSMVRRLFQAVLPDVPDRSPFSPEVMAWRIMGMLPGFLGRKEFAPLKSYLADDWDGLKRFQLAGKIADTFDQYTLFRTDMLLEWEKGRGGEWQDVLWRELVACAGGNHRGRLKEDFLRLMEAGTPGRYDIPERISVFGISYLPKYHLEILAATAMVADVNLFLLSPAREYWADIVPEREMIRLTPEERSLRIEGNPLLASLGKLGRDFSDMVIEMGDTAEVQKDLYVEPAETSLLGMMQSDILNLHGAGEDEEKKPIDPDDGSVRINSCHSPLREVEVLYDNLLDLLENLKGLEPRDIVVMTPDIEKYSPYISAVFEGSRDPAAAIPYSIADRSLAGEGRIASVVIKLMDLPGSRLTVPQVIDILESAPVGRRFGLDESELTTIRNWIGETRVRWGLDERHRARLGLPQYGDNSWRACLDRLLLGYAMPGGGNRLFSGILPYDDIEGGDALTLGKFAEFIDRVAVLHSRLAKPMRLDEWRHELRGMLDGFIEVDDDTARELATVAGLVEEIGELGEEAGFGEMIEPVVVRSWLSAKLAEVEKGLGFMTGGVTLCAMLPMRSIPFRVVALIGMNDGAFPRQGHPPGFDLISAAPRRGDRSLRDEDRYLFLEAVLSARDCIYISYIGQSIKDNSEIPPSVLVNEFLDAVERGFTAGKGINAAERLVTRHRLQAFSMDYFSPDSPLFSYSGENHAALLEKRKAPGRPEEFVTSPISPAGDEWKDVSLSGLLAFFVNPARFFLENRLGIRLEDGPAPLEEREPFDIGPLEEYNLKQELLEISLGGGDCGEFFPAARSRGILPPAGQGRMIFSETSGKVREFADRVTGTCSGGVPLAPLDFDILLGGFRLAGRIDRIRSDRMLRYRCAKMKSKDQVRAWIEHLLLNFLQKDGYPCVTTLLMTDGGATFAPVDGACGILEDILRLYSEGLSTPLRFFPESSMEYGKKLEWNLERARRKWESGYVSGEGEDPYFRMCFGRVDPFNGEFERVSRTLLEPLIRHRELE